MVSALSMSPILSATRPVLSREMNGQKVDHMQPIAMINGELYGYAENVDDLFVKVVEEELEKEALRD